MKYSISTFVYVSFIIVLGLLSALFLLIIPTHREWDPWPFFFFGALTLLSTSLSISFQGYLPSKGVIQISASFIYALFFLIHPAGVGAILSLLPLYDYFFNKRKLLTALFNIGQLLFSLAVASFIWFKIGNDQGLSDLSPGLILSALVALIIFSLINHLLTNIVIILATKKSLLKTGLFNKTALYNESAVITLGLSMAALWTLYPPLAILASVPIAILFLSLVTMSQKESALLMKQTELASLNDLALEIGAELDRKKLGQAIVRIVSKSLQVSAALLAFKDHQSPTLDIYASYGFKNKMTFPEKIQLPSQMLESEKGVIVDDLRSQEIFPEFLQETFTQYMAIPLSILNEKKAMLFLFSGQERRNFDLSDAEKINKLRKFIELALSNATLYENLKMAQQRLIQSEKLSAVGMLVNGVAHELNSPLTSIIGYSDLLYGQLKNESFKKKIEKIASEAQRASKIVQNLLTFARESKTTKRPIQINAIIERVLELKSYSFHANHIKVIKDPSLSLREMLADSDQIYQVLLNIMNNAEYALNLKKDGEKILAIKTFEDNGWIKIRLTNNGPPIPEDNLKKIFLPFFTTKEVGRGTGLGLSICYGIIREHQGRISVANEKEGVTFTIELPYLFPPEAS